MLTTYFKHPFTLRKLRSGPAGPYLDDFAAQLAQAGYSRNKIRAHLRGAGRFSAWAAQAELTIDAPGFARRWRSLAGTWIHKVACAVAGGNTAIPLSGLATSLTFCKPRVWSRRPHRRLNRSC